MISSLLPSLNMSNPARTVSKPHDRIEHHQAPTDDRPEPQQATCLRAYKCAAGNSCGEPDRRCPPSLLRLPLERQAVRR